MLEETIDDLFINFAIFVKAIFAFFVTKPIEGLRWLVQRYPKQTITFLLGTFDSLLGWAIFAQHVDSQALSMTFVLVLIGFAAMIATLFPLPD